jgi:type IV secretory pathway VirB10-like protein
LSSTSSEQNKDSQPQTQPESNTYYSRKKNYFSGIDNDHVNLFVGLLGVAIGSIALYPTAKQFIENLTNKNPNQQQQLPPPPPAVEEPYIPPTAPQLPAANGHADAQQPIEEQAPQPQEQPQKEGEDDGVFYEQELRRRQKLMGQKAKGSRYDSPFGKDIGGL